MTERAVTVAGADDEPLLPVQRLARKRAHLGSFATVPCHRLTQEERSLPAEPPPARPLTRGACQNGEHGERPCPFVGCAYHLYLEVDPFGGSIKFNFPHLEPWELKETCSLDVADRGGETLERVGELMNITRERVRQIEVSAARRLAQQIDNDNNPERAMRP